MILNFPGVVVPYVRMTQRSKFCDPAARRYLDNQAEIRLILKNQMAISGYEILPVQTPLSVDVRMTVTNRLHTKDADNQVKALFDAMKGVVYPDDRWIDELSFCRSLGDKDDAIIMISKIHSTNRV